MKAVMKNIQLVGCKEESGFIKKGERAGEPYTRFKAVVLDPADLQFNELNFAKGVEIPAIKPMSKVDIELDINIVGYNTYCSILAITLAV